MPDESRVKPQPLQPEELKAIEARCEAATSGPWVATISPDGTVAMVNHATLRSDDADEPLMIASCDVTGNLDNDADFIAAARTDIPRLLATIEVARREQPVRVTAFRRIQKLTENYAKDMHGCQSEAQQAFVYGMRLTKIRKIVTDALAAAPKEDGE